MKKANSKNKEKIVAEMNVSDEQLGRAKEMLRFPVTAEGRINRDRMHQMEYNLKEYEKNLVYHDEQMSLIRGRLRSEKLTLYKLRKDGIPVSLEEAKAILADAAKLPWVEKVSLEGNFLHLFTRKDMLKTVFDVQLVGTGDGSYVFEFLEGPVSASMPQYEIRICLTNMGGSWATNSHVLALRFTNQEDIKYFDGKGIIARQAVAPHWASNGSNGFDQWQHLCLGEYEGDLTKASAKGLVPFLNELALYLQLSGDQHAYRPKPLWALMIGKKEYLEFNGRALRKGETQKMVEERYTRDYKLLRQPEGATELTAGQITQGVNTTTTQTATTINRVVEQNILAWGGGRWIQVDYVDGNTPTLVEDCDCNLRDETDHNLYAVCDCDGLCECHTAAVLEEEPPF